MKHFEPIDSERISGSGRGKLPKYLLAAEQIREQIQKGTFCPGDRLPSERKLAQSFGVAYLTVRQALSFLIQEGFVERCHGKGTFVLDRQVRPPRPKRREQIFPPVYLLGLGPRMSARHDPVNWEIHLFRYQGIVEGGFHYGFPIEALTGWDPKLSGNILRKIQSGSGVILNGDLLEDDVMQMLVQRGVRLVAINRYRDLLCSEVQVDTKQGTILAVEHLLQWGHRRIGMIAGDQKKPLMRLRLEGYKEALRLYNVPFREELVIVDPRGLAEDGAAATEKFLRSSNPPTAIFTTSDRRAIGALARAKELGWSVPEQISIVGFDDLQEVAELHPPLTTVRNPLLQSGFEAVRLIHRHLQNPELGIQLVRLPMTLAVRGSSALLRKSRKAAGK